MNILYTAAIHEVKNLLAELALRLGNRGDTQQEMRIAMSAAQSLNEMLLVSRHAEGLLMPNIDFVYPADFLEILVADYQSLFPNLRITLDLSQAPDSAFFDAALVELALGNALHNACLHAKSAVHISTYQQEGMIVFEMTDDGNGYPIELLASALHTPMEVHGRGTGLGLYLANKIASIHVRHEQHGRVELANCETGAQFKMKLPC